MMKFDKRDEQGRPLWYDETKKNKDNKKEKEDIDLNSLTKDELNDFAANKGIDVDTKMLKKEMIKKILKEL
jgi:hypothetical protein